MKILFNCSTNVIGGGVKNSSIFIKYVIEKDSQIEWFFAISPQVKQVLDNWGINLNNYILFEKSPSKSIESRKKLKEYSVAEKVDMVYTMSGPAYVNFEEFHVLGLSNGYLTHSTFKDFWYSKNFLSNIFVLFSIFYQTFFIKNADFYIFQTNKARNGFCKRFKIEKNKTKIINNSFDNSFITYFNKKKKLKNIERNLIKIFCPASAFHHKMLHTIPQIAFEISKNKDLRKNIVFNLTIDYKNDIWLNINDKIKKLKIKNLVKNIGSFNYDESLELFEEHDYVFVPTFFETFTSTYLEAFGSNKPLIVSDKDFAKEICENAAIYVNPKNAKESSEKIIELIQNDKLQNELICNGRDVLKNYVGQDERCEKIIKTLIKLKK